MKNTTIRESLRNKLSPIRAYILLQKMDDPRLDPLRKDGLLGAAKAFEEILNILNHWENTDNEDKQ